MPSSSTAKEGEEAISVPCLRRRFSAQSEESLFVEM
jgi:hypothetical protein